MKTEYLIFYPAFEAFDDNGKSIGICPSTYDIVTTKADIKLAETSGGVMVDSDAHWAEYDRLSYDEMEAL